MILNYSIAQRSRVGAPFTGHSSLARTLSVDSTGRQLLTTSVEGAQLWDIASRLAVGQPFPTPIAMEYTRRPVWLPGGTEFAFAGLDGITVWNTDRAAWAAAACRLAGRNLTEHEWNTYGPGLDVPRRDTC